MQNRYVGDIGDFLKLGILRALSPGCQLGVAWWLFPDEDHNKDGRHIGYLDQPGQWRHFDPQLFDALAEIVSSGQRHVRALETADILPGTIFAIDVIPAEKQAREQWFASVQSTLQDADLVFVDPDNGLEPEGHSHGSAKSGKSVLLSELRELARPGRCLIVYHHHTRRKGGHHSEIEHWADRLRASGLQTVDALRARPYSPRVFFLLDAPANVRQRVERIATHWKGLITWHPDKCMKDDLTLTLVSGDNRPQCRQMIHRGGSSLGSHFIDCALDTFQSMMPMNTHYDRNMIMASSIRDFWKRLDGDGRVHPDDRPVFLRHEHSFNLDFPPPAFIGDVENAPVVVLMANGGYNPCRTPKGFPQNQDVVEFIDYLKGVRREFPTNLAKRYLGSEGNVTLLQGLLATNRVVIVNAIAYRSPKLSQERMNKRVAKMLPSLAAHRQWVQTELFDGARKGERLVVVHRNGMWRLSKAPSVPNVCFSRNPVSQHLSKTMMATIQKWLSAHHRG